MESDEQDFFNQGSSLEKLERRRRMVQNGVRKRVRILHNEEIDPYLIIRIIQMRYDRCSSKHIASVLNMEEDIVSSVVKKDQKILGKFIEQGNANKFDEYKNSFETLHLPTTRQVVDYRDKNFLKKRIDAIQNYTGLPTTTFSWVKNIPFVYEIAFIDKNRIYHLIRKAPENTMSFIGAKCWQLFHEGFRVKEIDNIFEGCYATGLKDFAKHIELKIDRRNHSINAKSIKETKSKKTEARFEESLHKINNASSDDIEFYMNINIGNGKIKSIRSIFKG